MAMKKYNTVLEYLVALEQLYKEGSSATGHSHENKEVIDQLTNELLEKLKRIKEVDDSSSNCNCNSFQILNSYNNMISLNDKKHYLCTNFSGSPNIQIVESEGDFQEIHLTIMTDSIIQGIYTTFQCKWYNLPQWLEPGKVYHLTFRRFLDTWTCDVVTYI